MPAWRVRRVLSTANNCQEPRATTNCSPRCAREKTEKSAKSVNNDVTSDVGLVGPLFDRELLSRINRLEEQRDEEGSPHSPGVPRSWLSLSRVLEKTHSLVTRYRLMSDVFAFFFRAQRGGCLSNGERWLPNRGRCMSERGPLFAVEQPALAIRLARKFRPPRDRPSRR
jgi:hypothetical protein